MKNEKNGRFFSVTEAKERISFPDQNGRGNRSGIGWGQNPRDLGGIKQSIPARLNLKNSKDFLNLTKVGGRLLNFNFIENKRC